jgi:hypothetical protein
LLGLTVGFAVGLATDVVGFGVTLAAPFGVAAPAAVLGDVVTAGVVTAGVPAAESWLLETKSDEAGVLAAGTADAAGDERAGTSDERTAAVDDVASAAA